MNKDQNISLPDIFWAGWKIGSEKEFPQLYKSYHEIGDKLDRLRDQIKVLENNLKDVVDLMPSWASNCLRGQLSTKAYAYYYSKEYNITVEEAEAKLLANFRKID